MKALKKLAGTITAFAVVLAVLISVSSSGRMTNPAGTAAETAAGTADSREEVVYANLTPDGAARDIYVVAILHNEEAGNVIEFGNFSDLRNMTDTNPLTLEEDRVFISAPKGDFYYQGTLQNAALPWRIDVTYTLDGNPVTADALAGAGGRVVIRIDTSQNPVADPVYFENYVLQVSVTLDTAKCANIKAPGATVANAGGSKQVTFTVMPGKAGALTLETDARDFSLAGIQFSAVPLSMQIEPPDTGDMMEDLSKLTDAVSELHGGFAQLESGSRDLKNGSEELYSGSAAFAAGLKKLSGNAGGLLSGSAQIKDGLSAMAASLSGAGSGPDGGTGGFNLVGLLELPDGLFQLAAGLDDISSGLSELKTGFAASYGALKDAVLEIGLYQDNPDKKDLIDTLASYYAAGVKVRRTYEAVRPAFDAVDGALDGMLAGIGRISGGLKDTAAGIKAALESDDALAQLRQLSEGLTALAEEYGEFHQGLTAFAAGVRELSDNYGALDGGIAGLTKGAGRLAEGLGEAADGVSELNGAVGDLPEKTDREIKRLIAEYDRSDVRPPSFASGKNVNTVSVQFVLRTDKIEKPGAPAAAAEPEQPATFWTRILDLFR